MPAGNFRTSLRLSPGLDRPIRQDAPGNLGVPTRQLFDAAVQAGDQAEALRLLDYLLQECFIIRDLNSVWAWYLVEYILQRRGRAAWEPLLAESLAPWIGTTAGLPGCPVATVHVNDRNARLLVSGIARDFHLTEGETRYQLTLGHAADQACRWSGRRQALEAAVQQGDGSAVQRLLDEQLLEERLVHDIYGDWAWSLLSVIGRAWGEAILGEVLRVTEEPWLATRYEKLPRLSLEESVQLAVEGMRGHFAGPGRSGRLDVVEEPERYVISFDPCGSGGRMRRGDPVTGSGSRLDPPYSFLVIQGAYPWTWNRKGVCAYCAHCAVVMQLLPIEKMGHPMRMVEYPDDAGQPCRWIVYKRPDGYPDAAYVSVGKEPPSRSPAFPGPETSAGGSGR